MVFVGLFEFLLHISCFCSMNSMLGDVLLRKGDKVPTSSLECVILWTCSLRKLKFSRDLSASDQ